MTIGDEVIVEVLRLAHGGHFVARHQGQVLFIRDVLPGERVRAQVTRLGPKGRYANAELLEVIDAAATRIAPPCRFAGTCGGCDFQHVRLDDQRRMKMQVVQEQLGRIAGIDPESLGLPAEAEAVDDSGLRWRTRMRLAVGPDGTAGLRRHGSHNVVHIDDCLIAHETLRVDELLAATWPDATEVHVAASPDSGDRTVTTDTTADAGEPASLVFAAGGRRWQVTDGFWQPHYAAAETLVEAVRMAAGIRQGDHVVDLYAGVGLFGGSIAAAGPRQIDVVEGHRRAAVDAEANLKDVPQARIHGVSVEKFVRGKPRLPPDVVILDPPRRGARRPVVEAITQWRPRSVVYVACDPAALARDIGFFTGGGYHLTSLRVFDLFPMTHHVECLAVLEPDQQPGTV